MKQILKDYNIDQETMSIHCDNSSAINIFKNHVLISHTKHIKICHHFIRDPVEENVVFLDFVPIEHQLANILTKPLDLLGLSTLGNTWAYA